jgi:Polyketide cyclase / dehydrase and lipid transport.
MTSVVEVDIDRAQADVAALMADPRNNTKWMDDVARVEPIDGELGTPGSTYRLVPREGNMVFVATVAARDTARLRLRLDASNVVVSVTSTLIETAPDRTRLISEEVFRFKGLFNTLFGFLAQASIKKVHRRHIEAFKRFAETHR